MELKTIKQSEFSFEEKFAAKIQSHAQDHLLTWAEFRRVSALLFSLKKCESESMARQLEAKGRLRTSREGVEFLPPVASENGKK